MLTAFYIVVIALALPVLFIRLAGQEADIRRLQNRLADVSHDLDTERDRWRDYLDVTSGHIRSLAEFSQSRSEEQDRQIKLLAQALNIELDRAYRRGIALDGEIGARQ